MRKPLIWPSTPGRATPLAESLNPEQIIAPTRRANYHVNYARARVDHDTHHGTQRTDGTVIAARGAVFEPRPLRMALPGAGDPPDPEQPL